VSDQGFTDLQVQMYETRAGCLLDVLGDIRVADQTMIMVWSSRDSQGIVNRVLSNELLDERVVHDSKKSHFVCRRPGTEMMLIYIEFELDEGFDVF
jgi:hypothetical protein